MKTLLAGPGRTDLVGGAIPERRMRLLQRAQFDRHVLVGEVLAFIGQRIGGQAGADALEGIEENIARAVVFDLVIFQLIGRHSAADADIEAAVAEMIEHADFLDQPER